MFNGDRIAFTTILERKKQKTLEDLGQQRLLD